MSVENPHTASGSFDYDIAVIGGGPGGYIAAIRAAQLGAKVAVVEKENLGGTCLNVGCIPTKAVISSVALYKQIQNAKAYGLSVDKVDYDLSAIVGGAQKTVKQLVGGIGYLLKKHNIAHLRGLGSLVNPTTIKIVSIDSESTVTAKSIILATGSVPARPRIEGLDEFPTVWTSDNAVFADFVPNRLVIVGGGAIGLEFGFIFNALGSKVTLCEMMPQILPFADSEASEALGKSLRKQGIDIRTNTVLAKADKSGVVTLKSGDNEEQLEADVILLAAGRVPSTTGLNASEIGVAMDRAAIKVNKHMQTSVPTVYAIGDCIGEPLLAHAASAEGEAAAANILGHSETVNYHAMPAAVYTHPEYASVGYTEAKAREKYTDIVVGSFQYAVNGRAMGERETEGFAKIIISEKYGEILGAHIVGNHASDLLAECATAIASELTIDELINSVHAHPTLSEVVWEAAMDCRKRSANKP